MTARRAAGRVPEGAHLVFVTHSIPDAMNDGQRPDGRRLRRPAPRRRPAGRRGRRARRPAATRRSTSSTAAAAARRISRGSSPTSTTTSRRWSADGVPGVVLVPIGFVSDHMEVVYDLDTEAMADRRTARAAGAPGRRPSAPTRGSSPRSASWCSSGPRSCAVRSRCAGRSASSAPATTSARPAAARTCATRRGPRSAAPD